MKNRKPTARPEINPDMRAKYDEVRRRHAENPVRKLPPTAIDARHFATIMTVYETFKAERERQGLTLAVVAERMGSDAPTLSRLENGATPNATLWTVCRWAEALGL